MLDSIETPTSKTVGTPPLQPMGFTDILDRIFSCYRNHFKLFLSIAAVYHISTFGNDLITTFVFSDSNSINILFLEIGLSFIVFLCGGFTLSGLIYASMRTYLGQHITAQGALRHVCHRFLPCFYSWLFVFFVFFVIGLLSGISVAETSPLIVLVSLFAIYFIIRWFFYGMSVLFEGSTPKVALQRSTELVKGNWRRVFGIVIAIYFMALMLALVLLASYFFILTLIGVIEESSFWEMVLGMISPKVRETGWLTYVILRFTVRSILNFTILPVCAIGATLLYFDLRIRKEAFDIEMRDGNSQDLM